MNARVSRPAARVLACIAAGVLVIAVPVAQVPIVSIEHWCCCPDPDDCHCPERDADEHGPWSTLRACHSTDHVTTPTPPPSFALPSDVIATPTMRWVAQVVHAIADPHPSPPPERPDAPS